MSRHYYYLRNHKQFGPLTSDELREMAAAGDLLPDDLLWKPGMDKAEPASKFKGLFAGAEPRPVAIPVLAPADDPVPADTPADPGTGRSRTARRWADAAYAQIERGGRATGLGPVLFAVVAAGLLALGLVMLTSLATWSDVWLTADGDWEIERVTYRGTSYPEGKMVFLSAMMAAVGVGLGLLRKAWLPASLPAAGAVGLFSTVILWALRGRLVDEFVAAKRELKKWDFAGAGMRISGGVDWSLTLCVLASVGAALAFLVAAARQPPVLALLQKPGFPPLIRRYGVVIAAYAAAILLGVAVVILRH